MRRETREEQMGRSKSATSIKALCGNGSGVKTGSEERKTGDFEGKE